MSTNDREKLLDKIKKLMTLANDPGASTNETQVALKKANRLLLTHNLSMSDVRVNQIQSDIVESNHQEIHFGSVMSEGQWEPMLMEALCNANLCHSLKYTTKYKSDGFLSIIGRKENVIIVKYLYDVACKKLRDASKQAYNAHRKEVLDQYRPQGFTENELLKMKKLGRRMVWVRNFLKGGVIGLRMKLEQEKKSIEDNNQIAEQYGLVVLNTKRAIENFINDKHQNITKATPVNVNVENQAFQIGVEKGKNTTLNQALASKHDNQLKLTQ